MRRFLNLFILASTSLVLGCLIVELSLRTFVPVHLTGYVGAYQYDAELGTRLKDNVHFYKTTDYQQEVKTNKSGTVNFQEEFGAYSKLVFTIGDSFTQGTGLPSDASYPFQLDLLLNINDSTYVNSYGIVNLGLAAFGNEQAIISMKRYAESLGNPDYVLYLGCFNDHMDDLLFMQGYRHRHLVDGNPNWGILLKPAQWFFDDTEIGKRTKLILGSLARNLYGNNDAMNTDKSDIPANIAELQEPVLRKLLAATRGMKAKLIVSWADLPGDSSGSYEWLKMWAAANDVAFADWHPRVESTLKAIPALPTQNQHSGAHYRTWVNSMIARSFAEQIISR